MSLRHLAIVLLLGLAAVQHAVAQPTDAPIASDDASIPPLPPLQRLPQGCGAVAQVVDGYTSCEGFAGWAGITVETFLLLNPLLAPQCDTDNGGQGLQPGSAACIGDTIAFCSNVYTCTARDTCRSIRRNQGAIINIDGTNNTSCAQLSRSRNIPVCINTEVDKCRQDTICGLDISPDLQDMLTAAPDLCDILSECQSDPELTEMEGAPSLAMTVWQPTPAVQAATATGAFPALTSLAELQQTEPAAALRITMTPNWFADDGQSGMTYYQPGEVVTATRKLLGFFSSSYSRIASFTQYPHLQRY